MGDTQQFRAVHVDCRCATRQLRTALCLSPSPRTQHAAGLLTPDRLQSWKLSHPDHVIAAFQAAPSLSASPIALARAKVAEVIE